jgi:hypothetical protein
MFAIRMCHANESYSSFPLFLILYNSLLLCSHSNPCFILFLVTTMLSYLFSYVSAFTHHFLRDTYIPTLHCASTCEWCEGSCACPPWSPRRQLISHPCGYVSLDSTIYYRCAPGYNQPVPEFSVQPSLSNSTPQRRPKQDTLPTPSQLTCSGTRISGSSTVSGEGTNPTTARSE